MGARTRIGGAGQLNPRQDRGGVVPGVTFRDASPGAFGPRPTGEGGRASDRVREPLPRFAGVSRLRRRSGDYGDAKARCGPI